MVADMIATGRARALPQTAAYIAALWLRMLSIGGVQEEQKAELKAQTDQMAAAFQERAARIGEPICHNP